MIETFLCHSCVRGCMALKKAFYVHSHGSGNPVTKKYKNTKFLKLKAQIISLFSGFPLPREWT